jgi:thioredoxin-like negative regulator of GroEL
MESVLAQLARKERDRLRVVTLDADRSPELAEAYAVREIPTLVLLRGRRPVARLEGRASGAEIAAMIEPHRARLLLTSYQVVNDTTAAGSPDPV